MILERSGRIWMVVGAVVLVAGCSAGARRVAAPAATAPAPTPSSATAATPPPPLTNTIRWSTASEVDNFGFDVYRGDAEEGPFVRLTSTPVAGAGTSDEPHAYRFVDETISAGKVYYYYVESISLAGVRERFTPVIRAAAKGSPAPPAPPGP